MANRRRTDRSVDTLVVESNGNPKAIPLLVEVIRTSVEHARKHRLLDPKIRSARIPKKNGKPRTIHVQPAWLRVLQTELLSVIEARWKAPAHVIGMQRGLSVPKGVASVVRAIKKLGGKRLGDVYVTSLDLKEYFDTIHMDLIEQVMSKDDVLGISYLHLSRNGSSIKQMQGPSEGVIKDTYKKLAEVATYDNPFMMQGLTLSPVIANMIGAYIVDPAVRSVLKGQGLNKKEYVYLRYADNIYIISKRKVNTNMMDVHVDAAMTAITERYIGKDHPGVCLMINKSKTKQMKYKDIKRHGKKILGCSIFNMRPAVGRSYWLRTRVAIHKDLKRFGKICTPKAIGLLGRLKDTDPVHFAKVQEYIRRQRIYCASMRYKRYCDYLTQTEGGTDETQ